MTFLWIAIMIVICQHLVMNLHTDSDIKIIQNTFNDIHKTAEIHVSLD